MPDELPTVLLRATTERPISGFGLPPELLQSARVRLGKFVLFMAVIFTVVTVFIHVAPFEWETTSATRRNVLYMQILAIALHLLLLWMIRSRGFGHAFALSAGLAYEVGLCFSISLADQWLNHLRSGTFHDVTFAHLIIAVYPLVVPTPPWRTLLSALTAAATIPLAFVILEGFGLQVSAEDYTVNSLSALISVAIAVFGSRVIYGMNMAVARARRLGSYQLESLLGTGGMGEVWRARHKLLARPAAIKLVRPEVLGSRGVEDTHRILRRFEHEAQATAVLRSPHTIQLYDFGIAEDGTFYYVMELLDGLDLQTLVERFGALPAERTVSLLVQACDSLAEAHENGLIHRDVKPANLYVCRYGRRVDFVKVLDFGLVKSSGKGDDINVTQEEVVGGTPAFMAPEQVLGNRPVDARTDVYALGCVGYWLLSGALVFEGSTAMETMMQHAQAEPLAPSGRTELPVPASLDRLILQCLEKNPERRPPGADALAESLRACSMDRHWTVDTSRQWWDRHLPVEKATPAVPTGSLSPTAN